MRADSHQQTKEFTFRFDYFDDPAARNQFKSFLHSIHSLDLELWERMGFWDDAYVPFSLFDGDRIVASVCLYTMDMMIGGERCRVGQFSGVGTVEPLRRRGLSRWLTERAIEWAAPTHRGFFLFADDDALPFYARCGFTPVEETMTVLSVDRQEVRPGLRKLNIGSESDRERVYQLACQRTPVSNSLGVLTPKLLMFHCLYTLHDHAYYLPGHDLVVFFKIENERMTVFDVIGREIPPFEDLHPFLTLRPHREICFQFMTDRLEIEASRRVDIEGSNAYIYPTLELPKPDRIFPYVAHA